MRPRNGCVLSILGERWSAKKKKKKKNFFFRFFLEKREKYAWRRAMRGDGPTVGRQRREWFLPWASGGSGGALSALKPRMKRREGTKPSGARRPGKAPVAPYGCSCSSRSLGRPRDRAKHQSLYTNFHHATKVVRGKETGVFVGCSMAQCVKKQM